ncbi:MAG: hypothetical protein HPY76_10285 [Anaerolineae bacterium]|jgi:two-component system sensor histidine kinase DegS|nr:hypothetical protein [Anaerolineae bacterium]
MPSGKLDKSNQDIELSQYLREEIVQAQQELKECQQIIDQSQTDLAKLTQRNTEITGQLQHIYSNTGTVPPDEIKKINLMAMDTQRRLLLMRIQTEKTQAEKTGWERHIKTLEDIQTLLPDLSDKIGKNNSAANLEMVINAQEAVRQRLSRQMHDGPAQTLSNFIVQMDIVTRLFEIDQARAKQELAKLKQSALIAFQKVRTFVFELRPMSLDDLGLFPTMRRYVEAFNEQTGLDVSLRITGPERRLEPYLEVFVFRGCQELIGNAVRLNQDSPMKPQIAVSLAIEGNTIKVLVTDNGVELDKKEVDNSEGYGINLLMERVEMLGGTMQIESSPGQGNRISFQLPILEMASNPAISG